MRVVQAIALLSVATLVPSAAGIVLPRADFGQQYPRRFPRNDTAIATAQDGSTTRISPLIQTPQITTSSRENDFPSLSSQTSPVESLEVVTSETASNSWSEAVKLPLTTTELGNDSTISPLTQQPASRTVLSFTAEQLDHGLTNSSLSTETTLSAQQLLESLSFSQVVSEFTTSANGTALSRSQLGEEGKDSISAETQNTIQASIHRRPHQGFAHPLTPTALNNTNPRPQTCGPGFKTPCVWIPSPSTSSREWNGTHTPGPWTSGTLTVIAPTSLAPCTTLQDDEPVTEYSIVYTATVTFFGNISEYTPPYPTISTPNFCETEPVGLTPSKGPGNVGGPLPSSTELSPKEPPKQCPPGQSCSTEKVPGWSNPTAIPAPGVPGLTFSSMRPTVTFITTDKNPAVVFTTDPPPRFDRPTRGGGLPMSNKQKAEPTEEPRPNLIQSSKDHGKVISQSEPTPGDQSQGQPQRRPQPNSEPGSGSNSGPNNNSDPGYNSRSGSDPDSGFHSRSDSSPGSESEPKSVPIAVQTKTFVVTARGQEVIVNDKTFSSLKMDQTTTVTIDYGTFTIRPTEVAGEGATVKKPQPVGTAVSVVNPTGATLGRVPVAVSGTEALVGGTTLRIPLMGTTMRLEISRQGSNTLVNERDIFIAPDRIVVDDQTLKYQGIGAPQTDVIIEGGEMVTAAGQSVFVFRSTTLTYGPSIPGTTETIDDDIVTVGPAGVVIDGMTLGGLEAEPGDTKHRIVGGATITKVHPSYVIIDETTFTAGPGAESTTKEAGGETITIGPGGIIIGTITVRYPFGASTVTTIEAKATASAMLPAATGTNNNKAKDDNKNDSKNDDDSGANLLRSGLTTGMTGLCIAAGVWIMV
ncbi:hypothetical protein FSPOR_851 [Fusarium sporotrichioides]|uniref:Uncharacterized protein n=1 Tax=Fusarium sporotrichioides TaxID=5514 RepID=A0A395SSZ6_FUSSP|nr:hypothetical protein FSPOR_851 [Fusarium sporotrichioides]